MNLQFDPDHIADAIKDYNKDITQLMEQGEQEGVKVKENLAKIEALQAENEQFRVSNAAIIEKINTIKGVIQGLEGLQAGQLPKV